MNFGTGAVSLALRELDCSSPYSLDFNKKNDVRILANYGTPEIFTVDSSRDFILGAKSANL